MLGVPPAIFIQENLGNKGRYIYTFIRLVYLFLEAIHRLSHKKHGKMSV